MSIRKLSQALLSLSLMFAALFCSTASAQLSGQVSLVPSRVIDHVDDTRLVTLHGNTHPMARPAYDRGLVEPNLPMERIMMVLKRSPEQDAALAAFDERQLDPASPDFHHWLTPEEFGLAYGPSDADIASVTGWLERHGFSIYDVSKGRVIIQFTGTAAQVQDAFHLEMHRYQVDGKEHVANDRDPQIPEALSPVVQGIASLHNFFPVHQSVLGRHVTRDSKTHKITPVDGPGIAPLVASGNMQPNFVFTDPNSGDQSEDIAPYDFATIYNLLPLWNAGYTGKGLSVAISAVTDLYASDISTFRKGFGLSGFAGTVKQVINGTDPGIDTGSLVENTLDTEWSGAAAPDAQIIVVISKSTTSTFGGMLSNEYIIDNKTALITSASYGGCEIAIGTSGNSAINSLDQQGSTEGLSLFESSGDQGSTGCDNSDATSFPAPAGYGLQVNGDASSPYITAVGGTDFAWQTSPTSTYWNATNAANTQSNAIGYIPELPWNSTCTSSFLLAAFSGENSNEQLCNDAAGSSQYEGLVKVTGGSGGKSSCIGSTNGEFSSCTGGYAKPSWQKGTGVPADGVRDLPDVSLFASSGYPGGIPGSAYLICVASNSPDKSCDYSGNDIVYQEVGGTSVSSPAMAGIAALILQKVGGSGLGLINPVLYQLAATESLTNCNTNTVGNSNNCIFYDITTSNNQSVCTTGSRDCVTNTSGDAYGIVSGYTSTTGYDLATGLGSVNVYNLVNAWPTTAATETLSFTPTSLTFPSTTVGATSSALSVTVKNTGTASVTFNTISVTGSTDFSSPSTNCPSPLTAGSSCTVSLTFKPAAAGTATGAISFGDSATGSPQTVALSGTGASAGSTAATITPSSLTFASTTVGSTSAAQTITLTNNTSASITFSSGTTVTGSGASSYLRTTTCSSTLAVGASCSNSVSFKPTTTGSLPATITYTVNGSPQTVALSGTGASASTGATITPSSLTFASTTVGSTSAAQTITLTNNTSASITFSSGTTVTGTGASSYLRTTTCSSTLAVGASCSNSVSFKPTTTGSLPATITYTVNGSPQSVALSGTGASASTGATITPSSLTFASTTVGSTSAAQTITLTNNTSAAITFSSGTTVTGSGASSFLRTTTCSSTLAVGASCSNSVSFKPTAAGAVAATITYTVNGSPQTVALYGTGASASSGATITPSSLTFASTTVGSTSAAQTITLTNNTSASITFSSGTTVTGTGASSYLRTTTCTSTLAVGASCSNSVSFKPTTTGSLPATITYTVNGSPQTVTLSGTGASASAGVTITPTSLTFASTAVGTSAATQVITLKNGTSAAVTFTASTTITGTNASSFAKSASTCANPLAVGASCTNTITFTPQSTGALAATVTYTDSASSTPQTVALYGTGH